MIKSHNAYRRLPGAKPRAGMGLFLLTVSVYLEILNVL